MDLQAERNLWRKGFKTVVGLDEAGRGPLAGPVVAGAVAVDCSYLEKASSSRKKSWLIFWNKSTIPRNWISKKRRDLFRADPEQFYQVGDSQGFGEEDRQNQYFRGEPAIHGQCVRWPEIKRADSIRRPPDRNRISDDRRKFCFARRSFGESGS